LQHAAQDEGEHSGLRRQQRCASIMP